ncbi:lipid-A-disaccharide synthase [Pseudomonas amygdali pv. tabaci str. ATCC 11528]|uniref:Lipid-A-disaccharide synthase n=4 Tax=Pseudomonas syringae group genomosp. 2 TaxID=251698 RepID=A0AAX1VX37_PSEAJ|nr:MULTISPECIES: lipid-A-disaccharide synthase [Pseudomonas syringae group]ARA80018.1 lipid-A-disaccharide synthase [Pseudomonas amygdali pv. lachrymans]KEZ64396.1 lipid-A-disaccharide synthase [Pseudomonas amygdali pv. tabaci str. ATCC 11528]KIY16958.1 lipid-A-disaccharide synthase [Pseudomonas amygdali pv. tabaci]KKY54836.1 lipid-A-disaccharide synthase [Pseudomonas amygdali pv. tabaci str. ATCC 11528]KKY58651.1 lipid-A-disaccharide synthase [Pseudomonas amygdali pv. lachrymans]
MTKPLCIALVAGEASGDILGSGLMRALKVRHPDIRFIGVGGPLMEAEGMQSYFPMERLSVMGLVEVLGRLRELLARRKLLVQTLINEKPDVFIGIDAPDFTLNIELQLRRAGIKTVHYVSPSVWAWRQKRVLKIREGCDLMLTLLPFEARFYEEKGVPVRFVGHPLADTIPLESDRAAARAGLGLAQEAPVVALMPGSRGGEVGRLGGLFFDAAELLLAQRPGLRFVLPCASPQRRAQVEQLLQGRNLPVTLLDGQSHVALAACDAVLIASGTATLEALLYKRPMVVAYRLAPLTFWILKRMVKSPYVSLPNLLAQRLLVPELLQDDATPEALARTLLPLIDDGQAQTAGFDAIHRILRRDASNQAADAVLSLLGQSSSQ